MSRGQITWNYLAANVYDQLLWEEVKGKYGSIAISYAVYSNAVTATVQVKLINGDNENPASICGVISASNTLSSGFIELFNTKDGHFVDVKPLEVIPLLRSVVVVPLTSSIKVFANLWHHEWLSIYTVDPIAQGSITFEAATSFCNAGRISGRYGEVEVMVTWSSSSD